MAEKLLTNIKNNDKKGDIIELVDLTKEQLFTINKLEKNLGNVVEVRKYKTGTYGAYFQNNQFRFIDSDKFSKSKHIDQWKIINTHQKDFKNQNIQKYVNNQSDISNIRFKVTDNRWSKQPSNKYLNSIKAEYTNDYKIGGMKKKVGLKTAVDLLRKYYVNNS